MRISDWSSDVCSSDLLADLGPHLIDRALVLFGMPHAITADVLAQRDAAQVDDYFELTLDYGTMRAVLSASTLVAAPRPRFAVHGTGDRKSTRLNSSH